MYLLSARESSVAGQGPHVKEHVATVDGIPVPVVDDALDGVDHVLHVLRGARLEGGSLAAQGVHVVMKLGDVAGSQGQRVLLALGGPGAHGVLQWACNMIHRTVQ